MRLPFCCSYLRARSRSRPIAGADVILCISDARIEAAVAAILPAPGAAIVDAVVMNGW